MIGPRQSHVNEKNGEPTVDGGGVSALCRNWDHFLNVPRAP